MTIEQDIRIRSELAKLHRTLFTDVMKVTLIARDPANAQCYTITTDDDLAGVIALLQETCR